MSRTYTKHTVIVELAVQVGRVFPKRTKRPEICRVWLSLVEMLSLFDERSGTMFDSLATVKL